MKLCFFYLGLRIHQSKPSNHFFPDFCSAFSFACLFKKLNFLLLIFSFFLSGFPYDCSANSAWQSIAPGLAYQDLLSDSHWRHLHAFRIDLKQQQLFSILASDFSQKGASIIEYARQSKAPLLVNGGFFDEQTRPLGLRISAGELKNPLKNISWWGIFYIKNQHPYLSAPNSFQKSRQKPQNFEFAIQAGPRLLIHGQIPPLKPGEAERSALCITAEKDLILVVTEFFSLSARALAERLKAAPLHCVDALNLDGGSSSQLYAKLPSFSLWVQSFSQVSDAIAIQAR